MHENKIYAKPHTVYTDLKSFSTLMSYEHCCTVGIYLG